METTIIGNNESTCLNIRNEFKWREMGERVREGERERERGRKGGEKKRKTKMNLLIHTYPPR